MKQIQILVFILFSVTSDIYSQINDSLYCQFTDLQIGLNSPIFENKKDITFKIYDEDFKIVSTFLPLREIDENVSWMVYDTISESKPLESVINEYDEEMDITTFEDLTSNYKKGKEITFVKHLDFIGDSAMDKIVFTEEIRRNKKYLVVDLYENINGLYIECEMCNYMFEDYPFSFYASKVKNLGMRTLVFIYEGHHPGKTLTLNLLSPDRISKPIK